MVLTAQTDVRENEGKLHAYLFILDFLDTVTSESMKQMQEHQALLRLLLEAAAKSGQELDQYIAQKSESVSNLLLCSSSCASVVLTSSCGPFTHHTSF